ncbi:hypothetical protein ACWC9U_19200 [Streptomyces sp. 900116325]
MASDVNIPVSELRQVQQMLSFVHDSIDIDRNTFNFETAFGPELARGAAQNFEDRWNDGKFRLKKQVGEIKDAIDNILETMAKTDQDAAAQLGGGQGK